MLLVPTVSTGTSCLPKPSQQQAIVRREGLSLHLAVTCRSLVRGMCYRAVVVCGESGRDQQLVLRGRMSAIFALSDVLQSHGALLQGLQARRFGRTQLAF